MKPYPNKLGALAEQFDLEPALRTAIEEIGTVRGYVADELIVDVGDTVDSLPLVLSGAIRILREDTLGGELLLYYIERGETCSATLNCGLMHTKSTIRAVAEIDAEVLFVPLHTVDDWMARFPKWRRFLLRSYRERFDELLGALDAIAFGNLSTRLLHLLRDKAAFREVTTIHATHQELADALHSSRVVVSRLLKQLEKDGELTIHRNRIVLKRDR